MKMEVAIAVPLRIFLVLIVQMEHPLVTDLVLRVLVDVPEEDGAVES